MQHTGVSDQTVFNSRGIFFAHEVPDKITRVSRKIVSPKICVADEGIIRKVHKYFAQIHGLSADIVIQVDMYPIEVDCNKQPMFLCHGRTEQQFKPIRPVRIH